MSTAMSRASCDGLLAGSAYLALTNDCQIVRILVKKGLVRTTKGPICESSTLGLTI